MGRQHDLFAATTAIGAAAGAVILLYSHLRQQQPLTDWRDNKEAKEKDPCTEGRDKDDKSDEVDLLVLTQKDCSSQGLMRVPSEIFHMNHLVELNLMNNQIKELSEEIGSLTHLEKLGLKGNCLERLPDEIGNLSNLVELYLTNNCLITLPKSIGRLKKVRKLQASFNAFKHLPEELSSMEELELFRACVNPDLISVPSTLSGCPSLTWLSLGGTAYSIRAGREKITTRPVVQRSSLGLGDFLGKGASGEVYKGEGHMAIKLFRGDVSPDGRIQDEIQVACLLDHPHLARVNALVQGQEIDEGDERKIVGVTMPLLDGQALADRPDGISVLRCRYGEATYTPALIQKVATQIASALEYLHSLRISHGDVYAHNIVLESSSNDATLLDFGASFFYDEDDKIDFERLEVRAFGLFLSELLARSSPTTGSLQKIAEECMSKEVKTRPLFYEIVKKIKATRG